MDKHDFIIKTIIGEAADQGDAGMLAVAETIRNRAVMRKLDPYQVVIQPKQYSFNNNPVLAAAWLKKNMTPELYQKAEKAYATAFDLNSNTTNGATNYFNPSIVKHTPKWARPDKRTAIVGAHHFYRD